MLEENYNHVRLKGGFDYGDAVELENCGTQAIYVHTANYYSKKTKAK